jgi:hypothetical protein
MNVLVSKEIKRKAHNVTLSDESNSRNSISSPNNEFAFVVYFGFVDGCTGMY